MKLDKKQVPQLIVLGLLVVFCVGYVSFTLMKPPAPAQEQSAKKSEPGAVVQVKTEDIPLGTFPNLTAPLPRRDPFAVQSLGRQSDISFCPTPSMATVKRFLVPKSDFGRVPPLNFGNPVPNSVPDMTVVPVEEPDPAFVLTGVIRGSTNIAIIRVGNSERHIVREGQVIDGRYTVLSVSDDGAVLACKDRRIHLKLGGVRNAS